MYVCVCGTKGWAGDEVGAGATGDTFLSVGQIQSLVIPPWLFSQKLPKKARLSHKKSV